MRSRIGRGAVGWIGAGVVWGASLAACATPNAPRERAAGERAGGEVAAEAPTPYEDRGYYNCQSRAFAHDPRCVVPGGPRPEPIRFPGE